TRLLDNSAPSDGNGNALFSDSKPKKQNKGKSSSKKNYQNSNQNLRKGIPPSDECSYCWKRSLPSRDHKHTSCTVLSADKQKNNNTSSSNTGSAKVASATDSTDIETGYAFMASSENTTPVDLSSLPSHFAMKASATKLPKVWIFDTGASHHITADISDLTDPVAHSFGITVGGGTVLHSTHKGTVHMSVDVGGRVIALTLSNVLYLPDWNGEPLLSWNVISPKCSMIAEDSIIEVRMKSNNDLILRPVRNRGLYKFTEVIQTGHAYMSTAQYWHECLGHSNTQFWSHAAEVYSDGYLFPQRPSNFSCEICAKANSKKVPPRRQEKHTKRAWDLLHTDLAGPFSTPTIVGALYYITFIDDYSNFAYIRFLKKKSDALKALIEICELICNEHGAYPRAIRSDRGGEYIN